jgi:hypothetical protein
MAIQRISQASNVTRIPITAAGTYTLPLTLESGFYRVTTDTTQTFSSGQVYFATAAGFRFSPVIRGGQGFVAIPQPVTAITLGTGTFPLLMNLERIGSYSLSAAPTNVVFDYETAVSPFTASISFTAPAGATGMGVYWSNGTFTDLGNTTSPKTAVALPITPTSASVVPALLVAKDANGVFGLGVENTEPFPFYVFTSSGTYTRPAFASSSLLIAVGGGGGSGGAGRGSGYSGGSGGGGLATASAVTTTSASFAITIGAGGTAGVGNLTYLQPVTNGGTGGTTTVLGTNYTGGLGGTSTSDNNAQVGGASANGNAGGTPALANPPTNGSLTRGGGGHGGAASPAETGGPGIVPAFTMRLGAGGRATIASAYGGGGAGSTALNGNAGQTGVVVIKAIA